jgi:hypothetical protein
MNDFLLGVAGIIFGSFVMDFIRVFCRRAYKAIREFDENG